MPQGNDAPPPHPQHWVRIVLGLDEWLDRLSRAARAAHPSGGDQPAATEGTERDRPPRAGEKLPDAGETKTQAVDAAIRHLEPRAAHPPLPQVVPPIAARSARDFDQDEDESPTPLWTWCAVTGRCVVAVS